MLGEALSSWGKHAQDDTAPLGMTRGPPSMTRLAHDDTFTLPNLPHPPGLATFPP
jgi:hypothetical protein